MHHMQTEHDNTPTDGSRCHLCEETGTPYWFDVSDGQSWMRKEVLCVCPSHTNVIFRLEGHLLTEAHPIGPVTDFHDSPGYQALSEAYLD